MNESFDLLNIGVIIIDEFNNIKFANKKLLDLIELKNTQSIIDKNIEDVLVIVKDVSFESKGCCKVKTQNGNYFVANINKSNYKNNLDMITIVVNKNICKVKENILIMEKIDQSLLRLSKEYLYENNGVLDKNFEEEIKNIFQYLKLDGFYMNVGMNEGVYILKSDKNIYEISNFIKNEEYEHIDNNKNIRYFIKKKLKEKENIKYFEDNDLGALLYFDLEFGYFVLYTKKNEIKYLNDLKISINNIYKIIGGILIKQKSDFSLFESVTRLMELSTNLSTLHNMENEDYKVLENLLEDYLKNINKMLGSNLCIISILEEAKERKELTSKLLKYKKIVSSDPIEDYKEFTDKIKETLFKKSGLLSQKGFEKKYINNHVYESNTFSTIFYNEKVYGYIGVFFKDKNDNDNDENVFLLETIGRGIGNHISTNDQNKFLIEAKELAERANETKSNFLAIMSHEIRTPLNSIIGFSEILAEEENDEHKLELLKMVLYSSRNLLELINDILDVSKIESGKLELYKTYVNMSDFLEKIKIIYSEKASKKGLSFELVYENRIPIFIKVDEMRLRQIIVNLLTNAIKFTEKGFIKLFVKYEKTGLRIKVQDTGVGIAANKIKTIFESFSQEDSSISRNYGGTGLGLSISKKLTGLMGGKISVESKKYEGSIFEFYIEAKSLMVTRENFGEIMVLNWLKESELKEIIMGVIGSLKENYKEILESFNNNDMKNLEFYTHKYSGTYGNLGIKRIYKPLRRIYANIIDENNPLDKELIKKNLKYLEKIINYIPEKYFEKVINVSKEERIKRSKNVDILVAEDSIYNQTYLKMLLEKKDLIADYVENGLEILNKIEEKNYDFILLDMHMPGMNGIEVLKYIRMTEKFKEYKVIALTADVSNELKEQLKELKCDDYISKPIERTLFFKTLDKYVSQKSLKKVINKIEIDISKELAILEENLLIFDSEEIKDQADIIGKFYPKIKEELYEVIENFDENKLEEIVNKLKNR